MLLRIPWIALLCMGCSLVMADETPPACPGAAAWQAAHPAEAPSAIDQRDAARTFTEPKVRRQLQDRFEADQHARRDYLKNPHDSTVMASVERLDADNQAWLKQVISDMGVPTAAQVGENGVKWAWVIVQHADTHPEWQASLLPEFEKRFEAGELSADLFAKLTDRVLLKQHQPQRFGTQFDWLSGHFNPRGAINIAEIDAHRSAIGLMPFADYACLVNQKLSSSEP
jgi:hypothetical protein